MTAFGGRCTKEASLEDVTLARATVDEFETVLAAATVEKPLQELFERHPVLLAFGIFGGLHQHSWVFPRPRLGNGKWIPDFLVCDHDSLGFQWRLIELESPSATPLNKDESVSAACHHAVEQIRDYRRWLRDNAPFERLEGWADISADSPGWVIIGRREERRALGEQRLADFRREGIEVHSYDYLLERCRRAQAFIESHARLLADPPSPAEGGSPG